MTRVGAGAVLLAVAVAVAGCAGTGDEGGTRPSVEATTAPLSGVAAGTDHADRGCLVVLREAARVPTGPGYEVDCSSGACFYVWRVLVDVADEVIAEGGEVTVSYQSGSDLSWWEAPAVAMAEGAPEGFERFVVLVSEHTVSPGMSLTSLMRTRIQMIPVVHMPGGGRLFDHNRLVGDFDNYELIADNEWSIDDDSAVCARAARPRSTVRFLTGWQTEQRGAVVAGGLLDIFYEPARLPDCRASYSFAPAWDIEAQGRFLPGGQEFSGSVVAFELDDAGRRHDVPHPGTLTVEVPEDATAVELWFRNWSAMSHPCESWDSDFGRNYRFDVVVESPPPVEWAGDWGNGLWRGCSRRDGLADPIEIDSYLIQRACLDVYADVYVPDVTDGGALRPELIQAEVELSRDGASPVTSWLTFVERAGNSYRYRWTLPGGQMVHEPWEQYRYAFRFSTDGVNWYRIATTEGPGGGPARTMLRTYSNPTWDDEE